MKPDEGLYTVALMALDAQIARAERANAEVRALKAEVERLKREGGKTQ